MNASYRYTCLLTSKKSHKWVARSPAIKSYSNSMCICNCILQVFKWRFDLKFKTKLKQKRRKEETEDRNLCLFLSNSNNNYEGEKLQKSFTTCYYFLKKFWKIFHIGENQQTKITLKPFFSIFYWNMIHKDGIVYQAEILVILYEFMKRLIWFFSFKVFPLVWIKFVVKNFKLSQFSQYLDNT